MIYYSNQLPTLTANDHPDYEFDGDVDLSDVKRFVRDRYGRRNPVCIHEFGIDGYRFDFVGLNPYKRRVRILEYKVDRGDFLGDEKHLGYMGYCNTFSFVTPLGLATVDELRDRRAGLLQVFRWRRRKRRIDRWYLGAIWLRRPTGMKLDVETYHRMVEMMLVKVVHRRDDVF